MAARVKTILDTMTSKHLFRCWFRDDATWAAWRAFLSALFALPMDDGALAIYRACTGRSEPPDAPVAEAWLVVGRRGGKSFVLALIAVFLAVFRDWRPYLQPGERGTVMVVAADRRQSRTILRYTRALLLGVPALKRDYFESETKESIELKVPVTIEVHTASFRTVRGYTIIAALLDETAFWQTADDAANPDTEIVAALRPAMSTVPGAMLLAASSPYARRGALYRAYRDHHGKDGSVLVWQADTRTMNPTVPEAVIEAAYEQDPASAAAEYGAQFRSDIENFVSREAVEACIVKDRGELVPSMRETYQAFCDPSGGSRDSMTLAIAHVDRHSKNIVVDHLRERRPPFNPDSVVEEFAGVLRAYDCTRVRGDRYAGEWPRSRFKAHGIEYEPAEKVKSDLYLDLLPLFYTGTIELPDNPRLVNQLALLERRTSRGGRDSIDHPPGGHDDLANVIAGVVQRTGVAVPSFRVRRNPLTDDGGVEWDSTWTPEQKARALNRRTADDQAAERRVARTREIIW